MSNLQLVKSENFGNVKCDFWQDINGNILMTRKQIGQALEYSDPQKAIDNLHSKHADRLDQFSVALKVRGTDGKEYDTCLYTTKGVMEICRWSQQPKADAFMDWVWEVVESIRKHGAYMTPETLEQMIASPEFGIKLLTALKEEQQKRKEAEAKLEEQKPMVLFAESCIASNDSLLVREVAKLASKKGIIIGEKRLWQKLRDWGEVSPKNEPYQHAMDAGRWEIKQGTYNTPYGSETYRTPKVTPKGQIYIIEKLKREQESKSA